MTPRCYEDGTLRAYIDKELVPPERDAVAAHLVGCHACQQRVEAMRSQLEQVGGMLADGVMLPDPYSMLNRINQAAAEQDADGADGSSPQVAAAQPTTRRKIMHKDTTRQPVRKWVIGLAAMLMAAALLAMPPVRALADQFLHIFRVQDVMFVPVSSEHMAQLESLDFDESTLFIGEPKMINDPSEPVEVASLQEASDQVGYSIGEPATMPAVPLSNTIQVRDRATFEFQVNVESAQQLLDLMDIDDVTIPASLGDEPIMVDVPSSVMTRYYGEDYEMMLLQGQSPEVALPEGVDLSELGMAMLRLLGMDEQQAASLSQTVDWTSTLIFPFPADLDSIRQVTINGSDGLLTQTNSSRHHGPHGDKQGDGEIIPMHKQLYWQDGDRFYVLVSTGQVSNSDMIAAAESVQ